MAVLERMWLGFVARQRCVVCSRFESTGLPSEAHHIALGSGKRSDFAVAPLCGNRTDGGHHRGAVGLHGPLGTKWFMTFYRPPGDCEYGLLVWFLEDLATLLKRRALNILER